MERPYGVSVAFFGLLFAILAAGCQSSDLPGRNRELTSQVYGNSPLHNFRGVANLQSVLFISMSTVDELHVTTFS